MRKRIDLRTLFQSLEDPVLPDGFTGRIMRQVAATSRPIEAAAAPQLLAFPMARWAQASIAAAAAVATLLLAGMALLVPSTWLAMLGTLEATLFTGVWMLTWTVGVLAESLVFLGGAARVGEALDLVLRTPQVTAVVAAAALASLTAVFLLHRFSSGPGGRRRVRGARAGALLLVGGLCFTGSAFGQPQDAGETGEAQEEASATLEDARERLDEALEEAGEDARGAIEETIERLDDLERDLNGAADIVVDLDNRVAFGSTVRVGQGEVVNDIVSIGGDVKVDGEVRGDAVSIGGEAKINGRVTGEVVSIGGDIELGPEAEVFGDIVTVGGQLVREEGSSVLGEVSEVDWGEFNWDLSGDWFDGWDGDWFPRAGDRPPFFRLGKVFEFVQSIVFTFLLIALSGLVLLVAPKGVGRAKSAAASDLWVMFAVGLGVEVFFLPVLIIVSLLLTVTVIGIPFAILLWPTALIGLAAAFVFGYTGSAAAAGDWCRHRFQGAGRIAAGSFGALALGVLTIQALALVADLLGFLGLPWFFRAMFRLPGVLICYLAWTIGLGAVFMTRFGTSDYGPAASTLPPTPSPADDAGPGADIPADAEPPPEATDDGDPKPPIPRPPAE